MIQDIGNLKLDNTYRIVQAKPEDTVFVFDGKSVLLGNHSEQNAKFPSYEEIKDFSDAQYLFSIGDKSYFRALTTGFTLTGYSYESMRALRHMQPLYANFALMTAYQLNEWYLENKYCGRCAHPMKPGDRERSMVCPSCGNTVYPKICPAVIIGCVKDDRIIVSRYRGRSYTNYALLAGFVEIGETFEETVAREVYEEVGLRVKNIRYYKSQPWGIDSDFLMGFYCEPEGDSEIRHIDEEELSEALWISRDDLPYRDDPVSLTSEMMNRFKETGSACLEKCKG